MATRLSPFRAVTPALVEQRGVERHRVGVRRVTVDDAAGDEQGALLHDLSIYGCRLAVDAAWSPDDRIAVRLDGQAPIAGRVIWCRDGFAGCRFDQAIAASLVRRLVLVIR